ncbi:hypothetical protein KEJ14_02165 [Candidatus Bathyarchaeota archaeon]|nr:hypothetical protein [Candidatus Bathyarchaeota archaeon]
MSKILPRRLSFSKICDILVAYLNAGADKEYVGVSEVAEKSTVTLHNISRNNGFLKSWGFIEESGKEQGKYKLTREAAEFAYAYKIDPEGDTTRRLLRNILCKEEALLRFVERMEKESMDRDSALVELPRVIGDLRADKVGLNAFLDLIAYAFQLDWLYASTKPSPPKKITMPGEGRVARKTVRRAESKSLMPPRAIVEPRATISINLAISPEVTPNMLKEYIKAMLKAYDEYFQERVEGAKAND